MVVNVAYRKFLNCGYYCLWALLLVEHCGLLSAGNVRIVINFSFKHIATEILLLAEHCGKGCLQEIWKYWLSLPLGTATSIVLLPNVSE